MTAFAVSNRSASPIEVTVDVMSETSPCPYDRAERVAFASTETIGWWRPRAIWRDLSPDEYQYDPQACSIRVTLPPSTTIRVAQVLNYTGPESGRLFGALRVTIVSPHGEITLAGLELVASFKKRSGSLYEYSYREPDLSSYAPLNKRLQLAGPGLPDKLIELGKVAQSPSRKVSAAGS